MKKQDEKPIAYPLDDKSYVVDTRGTAPNKATLKETIRRMAKRVRELYPSKKE